MIDRELLELAALAAGISHQGYCEFGLIVDCIHDTGQMNGSFFNPLTDDGDALRLAVAISKRKGLRIMLPEMSDMWAVVDDYTFDFKIREFNEDDPYAATRRAIVRAAAAIGRSMKATKE